MSVATPDIEKAIGVAAAAAEVALADGDTDRAREQFTRAGDLLKTSAESARQSGERNERLFLAASQYFHAGAYDRALRLSGRIQPHLLPAGSRPSYSRFLNEVRERARPGYAEQIRATLGKLHSADDDRGILEVLKAHPYVLPPGSMALTRALRCKDLGDYRSAALFYADAVRFGAPDLGAGVTPTFLAAGAVLSLHSDNADAAWQLTKHLLELLPHPLVSLAASLLLYLQAIASSDAERNTLFRQQLDRFEQATAKSSRTDTDGGYEGEARLLGSIAHQAAALTYFRFGQAERAKLLAEQAVILAPNQWGPEAVRKLIVNSETADVDAGAADVLTKQVSLVSETGRTRSATLLSA